MQQLKESLWLLLRVGLAAIKYTLVISTVMALYIVTDASATRVFASDEPEVVHFEGKGKNDRAIVYIGGAGSSPLAQSVGLLPALKSEANDLFVIENPRHLFNENKVIDLVIRTIQNYPDVVMIGGSMGGLLSYDTVRRLRNQGDKRVFTVILIDSPVSRSDVAGVKEWQKDLSAIPLGWTTSRWFPSTFDRNKPAVIDLDADWQQLKTLWRSYETWEASSSAGQGNYVFSHEPMIELTGVRWHFIQSGADTFVNGDGAFANWQAAQRTVDRTVIPDSEHLSLLNRPSLYNQAIVNVIRSFAPVKAATRSFERAGFYFSLSLAIIFGTIKKSSRSVWRILPLYSAAAG